MARKKLEPKELSPNNSLRAEKGYRWMVSWPVEGNGKVSYKKKFFRHGEQEKAKAFASAQNTLLQNQGREVQGLMDETTTALAARCVKELAQYGKSLSDAVEHYVTYLKANEKSCSVSKLTDDLIDTKEREGRSERYLSDLKSRLGRFERDFGERNLASIEIEEISQWLINLKLTAVGQNNYRRLLVLLFNEGIKRKFCKENPAYHSIKAKEIESEVSILTPEQAARLLAAADPEIIPALAIGLFAGLRASEILRLDWEEVDFTQGHILVKAEKAKSARRRYVSISDNLHQWLMPFAKAGGKLVPNDNHYRKLFDLVREKARLLKTWKGNELRHSFASYHLAQHVDSGKTTTELGHTSSALVFRHYRNLVTPQAAETYWHISPATTGNLLAFPSHKTA